MTDSDDYFNKLNTQHNETFNVIKGMKKYKTASPFTNTLTLY